MDTVTHFLQHHSFWLGVGSLWIFSALTAGMPLPTDTSGVGYRWAYASLHALAANLEQVAKAKNLPLADPVPKV